MTKYPKLSFYPVGLFLLILVLWLGHFLTHFRPQSISVIVTPTPSFAPTDVGATGGKPTPQSTKTEIKIPARKVLSVPFTPQAPHANWDETYKEACEEASLLIVHHYLQGEGKGLMDADNVSEEILKMVDYQMKNWGGHYDLTAEQTAKLAKEYYGYKNVRVNYDVTIDDIKKEVADGNPVIVPAAGRELHNPNFRQPGPIYHMLVVIGYDGNTIISNDPGTRKGMSYEYNQKVLYNAMHEWAGSAETILQGRRAMIVIYPE